MYLKNKGEFIRHAQSIELNLANHYDIFAKDKFQRAVDYGIKIQAAGMNSELIIMNEITRRRNLPKSIE